MSRLVRHSVPLLVLALACARGGDPVHEVQPGAAAATSSTPLVIAAAAQVPEGVRLSAAVTTNVTTASVDFVLDSQTVGTATARPYALVVDSALSAGSHTLVAKATDTSGKTYSSESVSFVVTDPTQLIKNGGFEDGLTGWTVTVPAGTANRYNHEPLFTFRGLGSVILGGTGHATTHVLSQDVSVPAGGAWLSLAVRIAGDGIGTDTLDLAVTPKGGTAKQLFHLTNRDASDYAQRIYDLSAYAGKTVTLALTAVEDSSSITSFMIDEVDVRAKQAGDVTPPRLSCDLTLPVSGMSTSTLATLTARAADASGIAGAAFLLDGVQVQSSAVLAYSKNLTELASGPHALAARVTDAAGNAASCSVPFYVGEGDITPPTAVAQVSGAQDGITVSGSGRDTGRTNVRSVTLYVDDKQVAQTTDRNEVSWNTTAASLGAGLHTLRVEVKDVYGNTGSTSLVFEAAPASSDTTAPKVTLDVTDIRYTTGVYTATASDAASGVMAVQFYLGGNLLSTVLQPPYTVEVDLADLSKGTTTKLEARAIDAAGNVNTATKNIARLSDFPPYVDASADQTVMEGDTVTLPSNAADYEGQRLTYSWSQLSGPPAEIADPTKWRLTFTAPEVEGTAAELVFELRVSDGVLSDADTVKVTVKNRPGSPAAEAGPDQTVNEGDVVTLSGSATDDGTIASYRWVLIDRDNLDPVVFDDPNAATTHFTAPAVWEDHTLVFQLTATDDQGLPGHDTVTVKVKHVNRPPTAEAGPDQTANEGAHVELLASATDPDSSALKYKWTQLDGLPVTLVTTKDSPGASFFAPLLDADVTLTFLVTVDDGAGATATDTLTVTVKNVPENVPPVALAGSDLVVKEGAKVTLAGSAFDPDGGTIVSTKWSQQSGPSVGLGSAESATATFTAPTVDADTTLVFRLTVQDDRGGENADDVTVTVQHVNRVPTVSAADQDVKVGATVSLAAIAKDVDGSIESYAWTQTSGPSVTLAGADTATATFVAPAVNFQTWFRFKVTVTDDARASATAEVAISVKANQPPTVSVTGQTVNEKTAVTLTATASDSDGTVASYAWTQTAGPAVTLSGAATATPTFTAPSVTADTVLTFQVVVKDDSGSSAYGTASVTVKDVPNVPPTVSVSADQQVLEGALVTISATGADSDGKIVSYAWKQTGGLYTVSLANAKTATATFSAPGFVSADLVLTFQVTVTDDAGGTATGTVKVTVLAEPIQNQPPSVNAGADVTAREGEVVTLAATASDPDGSIARYAWTQTAGSPTVALEGASGGTVTFTAPSVSASTALTFRLTVTDDKGGTSSDEVTVTVTDVPAPANQSPTASAGQDPTVDEGATVTLLGSGTDGDGTIAAYAWRQVGGPAVTLSDVSVAKPTFTAPAVSADTVLTFELTVTDDDEATASATVKVTVHHVVAPANQPPTVSAGANQSVTASSAVTLTGTANDGDGTIAKYAWVQTGGPKVTLTGADTARPTFTAPTVDADTVLTFQMTATDDRGASATETVQVAVKGQGGGTSSSGGGGGGGCNTGGVDGAALTMLLGLGLLRRLRRRR